MKHFYGWRPDTPDQRDLMYRVVASVPVPADLDMRPEQPPVFDQGQLGSCTANATAACFQYDTIVDGKDCGELSRGEANGGGSSTASASSGAAGVAGRTSFSSKSS